MTRRPARQNASATGLADEHSGRGFVILDGTDGRAHHVLLKGAPTDIRPGDLMRTGEKRLEPLDQRPLEAQIRAPGLTWLDRHLAGEEREAVLPAGFGAEVREAEKKRLDVLERRGLIRGMDQPLRPDAATLEKLRWSGISRRLWRRLKSMRRLTRRIFRTLVRRSTGFPASSAQSFDDCIAINAIMLYS